MPRTPREAQCEKSARGFSLLEPPRALEVEVAVDEGDGELRGHGVEEHRAAGFDAAQRRDAIALVGGARRIDERVVERVDRAGAQTVEARLAQVREEHEVLAPQER